ncbi:MAG: acyltransferase family protein, partial [Syntrophales bacterium]
MIKNPDTQFLRALAIILVINSHLDKYYPISYIGTGGAIGNSIFFFLSAYGLYLSQQKKSKRFSDWYAHRIGRIYPSLWIVLLSLAMPVMIVEGKLSISTITTFMGYFFSPPYWFIQVLLIYYLLAFPLLNNSKNTHIIMILVALVMLYVGCYVTIVDLSKWSVEKSPFDLIHYFMMFIFGICIAKVSGAIKYAGYRDFIFLLIIFGLFYAHKYFML